MPNTKKEPLPYHWFVSSVLHWNTNESLSAALATQKRMDRGMGRRGIKADVCYIWRVPVPADTSYPIDFYAPQVDGAEYVGPWAFTKKAWERLQEEERTHSRGEKNATHE